MTASVITGDQDPLVITLARKGRPMDADAHLTGYPVSPGTYSNHKCRCSDCTRANTEARKLYRERVDYAAKRRARRWARNHPYEPMPEILLGDPDSGPMPRTVERHEVTDVRRLWFEDLRAEWD